MAYPQINTVVDGSTVEIITTQRLVPTVQTTISVNAPTISTIVQNYWDGIWSINGQTGDVTLSFKLGAFEPNTPYEKDAAIVYNGAIWLAKGNFVSGDTFDDADWNSVSGYSSADKISYDNMATEIPAATVQEAIDIAFINGTGIKYVVTNELPQFGVDEKALYLIPVNSEESY